ncbi:MAG TPA: hypothetical protein VMW04_04395 [Patescibacteria group bacterium]|nr:hypothetical protein [Patescibacteria group bacterium]
MIDNEPSGLSSEEELEQRAGIYRNLSKFSSQTTADGEWATFQDLKICGLEFEVLKVNIKDVVGTFEFSSLPKQVLAGSSPEELKKIPTFFIQDGFPGLDYISHFYIKDGKVGYMNGKQSGNARPSLDSVKEAGILCEELPYY